MVRNLIPSEGSNQPRPSLSLAADTMFSPRRSPPTRAALLLTTVAAVALLPHVLPSAAIPYSAPFTTARPAEFGDRCFESTMSAGLCATGQKCIKSGRTEWWDERGPYRLIEMTALHTQLCTSLCCPEKPPVGTCCAPRNKARIPAAAAGREI
jgi:hypothetical protein